VWPQDSRLQYFDSLGNVRKGSCILRKLARWLLQDAGDKGVALPCSSTKQLKLELQQPGMPRQVRGSERPAACCCALVARAIQLGRQPLPRRAAACLELLAHTTTSDMLVRGRACECV
jgi:hypothetical protein